MDRQAELLPVPYSNRFAKEIALQGPKTGKFDYLSGPNHPAHSIAFKFFTDDYLSRFESAHRKFFRSQTTN
jgi:hypothetical protein